MGESFIAHTSTMHLLPAVWCIYFSESLTTGALSQPFSLVFFFFFVCWAYASTGSRFSSLRKLTESKKGKFLKSRQHFGWIKISHWQFQASWRVDNEVSLVKYNLLKRNFSTMFYQGKWRTWLTEITTNFRLKRIAAAMHDYRINHTALKFLLP